MQYVVFLVRCGDDHPCRAETSKHGVLDPRELPGGDVFDGFQENGRIDLVLGPIDFLERSEPHMQTIIRLEQAESEPVACVSQCLSVNIDASQPGELVVLAKPEQQFPLATAEVCDMLRAADGQGINDGIDTGKVQR